jgi:hypothetical protein
MPNSEQVASFRLHVQYLGGKYVGYLQMKVGRKEISVRGVPLTPGREQTDLYNYATEELAWWVEEAATTVTADRQARDDGQLVT